MNKKSFLIKLSLILIVASLVIISGCSSKTEPKQEPQTQNTEKSESSAKKLPDSIQLATLPEGMLTNTLSVGFAKMFSEKTPMKVNIRVTTGGGSTLHLVNNGDSNLSLGQTAVEAQAYSGREMFKDKPVKNIRMIAQGAPLTMGFIVKKDSDFKDVSDLKGAKLAGEFKASRQSHLDGSVLLATAGLTWDDVKIIPVGNMNDGMQAFMEGRVDATVISVSSQLVAQADAIVKGGVRFIPVIDDQAKIDASEYGQGYSIYQAKAGSSPLITEDTTLVAVHFAMETSTNESEELVYELTKSLWENVRTLDDVHPNYKQWDPQKFVSANAPIPYHPGAIKFYKEKGVWSSEMDSVQDKLLKQ